MKGKIQINKNDHRIEFDFDNFSYSIISEIVNEESIDSKSRLEAYRVIEKDSNFVFLRKCLHAKYNYEKVPDSDKSEYEKCLQLYDMWNKERFSHIVNSVSTS